MEDTFERVARLQKELHEGIVEQCRKERLIKQPKEAQMNTILRKAGQVAKKVNKVVNPAASMAGFFKKSNEIHICGKCGAEYMGNKPELCENTIIKGVAGDPCGSIHFTTVNSLSEAESIHAQREEATVA